MNDKKPRTAYVAPGGVLVVDYGRAGNTQGAVSEWLLFLCAATLAGILPVPQD